jgi:outer membrane biosynthesis protein TonB
MRFIFTAIFSLTTLALAFAQPQQLTEADMKEIRTEARKIIEIQLNDLLNHIALDNITESNKQLMIYDSYMESQSQIFYGDKAVVEDDVNPDNTVTKSGPDLSIRKYLDDLKLYYTKSSKYSIKISEVSVGQVQRKDYPYVLVNYKMQFTNAHRQKTTKYESVYRVAELRAEKPDKQWIVLITRIGYYQPAAGKAPAANPGAVAVTPVEPAKKAEAAVSDSPAAKPIVKEVASAPAKETPAVDKPKEQVPVTEMKKTQPADDKSIAKSEPKKEEPAKPDPKKEKVAEEKPVEKAPLAAAPKAKSNSANAELASLQQKAAKYQRQSTLIRVGSGVVVAASVATGVILFGAYNDYKSEVDANNAAFKKWWDTSAGGGTNGERFGSYGSYTGKPESLISFASPGIYAAGAGIIAGGVLWFLGSKSAKEAKRYKKLVEQKKGQISISPQWNGSQRYAGIYLKYKF